MQSALDVQRNVKKFVWSLTRCMYPLSRTRKSTSCDFYVRCTLKLLGHLLNRCKGVCRGTRRRVHRLRRGVLVPLEKEAGVIREVAVVTVGGCDAGRKVTLCDGRQIHCF